MEVYRLFILQIRNYLFTKLIILVFYVISSTSVLVILLKVDRKAEETSTCSWLSIYTLNHYQ